MGGLDARANYIENLCAQVEDLLFTTPQGSKVESTQSDWMESTLKLALSACRARLVLRGEDLIDEADVVLLASYDDAEIKDTELYKKRKKGGKYDSEDVIKHFEREKITV